MKNYWYFLVILAFAAGCTAKGNVEDKNALPQLPVIQVSLTDTILQHDYVTSIEAVRNVEIRARVQGFLSKIFVDEGHAVKKGEPLFQLDDHEFANQLAKARANVNNAKAEAKTAEVELKRVNILLAKNIVSPSELEMAKAKLKAAEAMVEEAISIQKSAETKLSYTYIRSPFDGIIDRIPLKVGSLVDEGALLTTISDNHEIYAYFNVSESEYLHYRKSSSEQQKGNTVELILADGTIYNQMGKIETVESEFDEGTGSIAFRARFPNPSKLLKHGATGKVRLSALAEDALFVPQKSVFEIQDKNYVFLLQDDNTVKMQSVVPQTRVAQYYIIADGLKKGDRILYEGVQNIKDGARIIPVTVTRQM